MAGNRHIGLGLKVMGNCASPHMVRLVWLTALERFKQVFGTMLQ
jgi:hypothetical protein